MFVRGERPREDGADLPRAAGNDDAHRRDLTDDAQAR